MDKIDYLIIGNGIAGYSAAKEIRSKDQEASILLVSKENYNTYYRMKLTGLIAEDFESEDVLVSKADWYREEAIEVRLNTTVEKLDLDKKCVILDDGSRLGFSKLLIAAGSRPFVPPIKGRDKEGVFALRTIDDVRDLQDYLSEKENVSVIGGGLLGLEAAWSLKEVCKNVTIINRGDRLLNRQLDRELSKLLEERLREEGFKILLDINTEEILGSSRVEGLSFDDGSEIPADGVLISAGVRPDLDLLEGTEILCDRGVKVDPGLRTNVEDVYAAGDIVEIDGITLGLWTASNEQGKIAGQNMAGGQASYDIPKLFATLRIGDISIFSAGNIDLAQEVYEARNEDRIGKIMVRDGRIVASILYGKLSEMGKLRKATFAGLDIDEFLEEEGLKDQYRKIK